MLACGVSNQSELLCDFEFMDGLAEIFLFRLRTHNQNKTVAAMQMALMNVWAHRSYRAATLRQSLSIPNMRSTRLRCW
ncbi:MAG: hypothetical protein ACJAVR_004079 [Paracoccaceae bacterium]|jgi:hypothetical protein